MPILICRCFHNASQHKSSCKTSCNHLPRAPEHRHRVHSAADLQRPNCKSRPWRCRDVLRREINSSLGPQQHGLEVLVQGLVGALQSWSYTALHDMNLVTLFQWFAELVRSKFWTLWKLSVAHLQRSTWTSVRINNSTSRNQLGLQQWEILLDNRSMSLIQTQKISWLHLTLARNIATPEQHSFIGSEN